MLQQHVGQRTQLIARVDRAWGGHRARMKKLVLKSVVQRPLKESLQVATTAVAWNKTRNLPLLQEITALLGAGVPASVA